MSSPVKTPCRFHTRKTKNNNNKLNKTWLTPLLKVTADVAVEIKVLHVTVSGGYRTWTPADTQQPAATRTVIPLVSPIPQQLSNLLNTLTHAHTQTNHGFTEGFHHWREGERERKSGGERLSPVVQRLHF